MKTVNVVAAVIRDENKIFATQRGYGDYKDGWEFPGEGTPVLKEHEAARWLDAENLDCVDWLPADLSIIRLIKEQMTDQKDSEHDSVL